MTLLDIPIYFVINAVAGAINAVAGGGTFLVFPILIFKGWASLDANILSTVALWPASVSSAVAYRGQIQESRKDLLIYMLASIAGSIVGTTLLLTTPILTFEKLIPWLLLFATLVFTFGSNVLGLLKKDGDMRPKSMLPVICIQFLLAIYGGYFGAGVGILMMALFQLMGLNDIYRLNALKALLASVINAVAVLLFIFSGRIVWQVAGVMVVGGIVGGYFGARFALLIPPDKLRIIISVAGFGMSAYFFLRGV